MTSAGRVSLINIIMKITRWWFMKEDYFIVICVEKALREESLSLSTRKKNIMMVRLILVVNPDEARC